MKNKFLFILFFIFSLGFFSAVVITDDLHLNIQTTDTSGNIVTGTFAFVFNISDTSDCSNIIYTNSTSLTTDLRGIISYYLPNVSLDYDQQYWLCYYRDGSLISNSKIARIPYAFRGRNVSLSGIEVDSNFDLGSYNFTTLGRIGVGTTSPDRKLHIEDSGTVYMLINSTTSGSTNEAGIYLDRGDVANGYAQLHLRTNSVPLNKWDIGMYAGSGGLRFYDYSGTPDIRLFIENNTGNVGIGTTTPSSGLHISSPSYQDHILIDREGNGSYITQSAFSTLIEAYGSTNALDIFGGVMEIGTDGKVGIGTTNPSQKLDVLGAIQLSDNSGSNEAGVIRWTGSDFQGYNGSSWNTFATSGGGSLWSLSESDIYYNNGNVGIGTASPGYNLHINESTGGASANLVIGSVDQDVSLRFRKGDVDQFFVGYDASPEGFRIYDAPNATTRLFVDSGTGNVGIGTTSPTEELHVNDTGGASYVQGIFEGSNGSGGIQLINDVNQIWEMQSVSNASAGLESDFIIFDRTGTSYVLVIQNGTGNVGIGTTNPVGKLHIVRDTSRDAYIRIESNNTEDWTFGIYDNAGDGNSDFYISGWGSSVSALNIKGDTGNVGIGTASPAASLHVEGAGTVIGYFRTTGAGEGAGLSVKQGPGDGLSYINFGDDADANIGQIRYNHVEDELMITANNSVQMTIDADGNVGIGTSSPVSKLHVLGAASVPNLSANNGFVNIDGAGVQYQIGRSTDSPYGIWIQAKNANLDGATTYPISFNPLGGNVGIGTDNPINQLHVYGDSIGVNLRVQGENQRANVVIDRGGLDKFGRVIFVTNDTNPRFDMGFAEDSTGKFYIGDADLTNKWFTIENGTGNVGIGTSSPALNLHVEDDDGAAYIRISDTKSTAGTERWAVLQLFANNSDVVGDIFAGITAGEAKRMGVRAGADTPLMFYTNGTEKMIILTDGNVGIGDTTPGKKLDVAGTGRFYSATNAGEINFGSGTQGRIVVATSTFSTMNFEMWDGSGYTSPLFMEITGVGTSNVGIGTTSPGEELDINGSIRLRGNGESASQILNFAKGADGGTTEAWHIQVSIDGLDFVETGVLERMFIQNGTGNVGIGTTSPSTGLHVYGTGTSSRITAQETVAGSGIVELKGVRGAVANQDVGRIRTYWDGNNIAEIRMSSGHDGSNKDDGHMYFMTSESGSNVQTRMTIEPNGNVGIGTASPYGKLSIANADASGKIFSFINNTASTRKNWIIATQQNVDDAFEITPSTVAGGKTFTTPALTILSGGNVGIGDSTPSFALDVNGQIKTGSSVITWSAAGSPTTTCNTACASEPTGVDSDSGICMYAWQGPGSGVPTTCSTTVGTYGVVCYCTGVV